MLIRTPPIGLVVAAPVLMQPLVVGPVVAGDVGVLGRPGAVPIADPDVVGLGVARLLGPHKRGDPRGGAAVDAGHVSQGVQLLGPPRQESEHRRRVRGVDGVSLHVVVDRIAGGDPERLRVCDGVARGRRALGAGPARADRRAAAVARSLALQSDVGGDQLPAGADLAAHPAGSQVRLRAPFVDAADIDADRLIRRSPPSRHRVARGRAAGVEPEPRAERLQPVHPGAGRGRGSRLADAGRAVSWRASGGEGSSTTAAGARTRSRSRPAPPGGSRSSRRCRPVTRVALACSPRRRAAARAGSRRSGRPRARDSSDSRSGPRGIGRGD